MLKITIRNEQKSCHTQKVVTQQITIMNQTNITPHLSQHYRDLYDHDLNLSKYNPDVSEAKGRLKTGQVHCQKKSMLCWDMIKITNRNIAKRLSQTKSPVRTSP